MTLGPQLRTRSGWRAPVLCALITATALTVGAPAASAAPTSLDVLSWSDEFDGSNLDLTRWAYRASGPRQDGILTPDAVSVANGLLTIKTYTEAGTHYSGMIATNKRGSDGFEQAYGYFEARMKFNNAPGQWSSFWLQSPTIGQPIGDPSTAGVEMDVVEHRARCVTAPPPTPAATCSATSDISDRAQQALVWDGYGPQSQSLVNLSNPLIGLNNGSWHTWALRWTPTALTFYYDDTVTWTQTRPISRTPEYLILSSEVGQLFAGQIPAGGYGTRATSTTDMQVDYVRAYTPAIAPVNTAAPQASGTPEVGQTLSCDAGTWAATPPPAFGYQWLRDDGDIAGASTATYTLQSADAQHDLGCRVTATNPASTVSASSSTLRIRNQPLSTLTRPSSLLAGAAALPVPLPARGKDRTPPSATITAGRSQKPGSSVNVSITCPRENCRATTRGTIRALWPATTPTKHTRPVSSSLAKGIAITVKLRLSRSTRLTITRALEAHKRIVMQLDVRVADDAGNTRTLTRQVAFKL